MAGPDEAMIEDWSLDVIPNVELDVEMVAGEARS
jgi:hypothetical protein